MCSDSIRASIDALRMDDANVRGGAHMLKASLAEPRLLTGREGLVQCNTLSGSRGMFNYVTRFKRVGSTYIFIIIIIIIFIIITHTTIGANIKRKRKKKK